LAALAGSIFNPTFLFQTGLHGLLVRFAIACGLGL
jgi:hypothetical protein